MPKPPRRTDADYIRFPPNYVFKSVPYQNSGGNLWKLGWTVAAVIGLAVLIFVAGFWIVHAALAQSGENDLLQLTTANHPAPLFSPQAAGV